LRVALGRIVQVMLEVIAGRRRPVGFQKSAWTWSNSQDLWMKIF
jgi:hypothetical protein